MKFMSIAADLESVLHVALQCWHMRMQSAAVASQWRCRPYHVQHVLCHSACQAHAAMVMLFQNGHAQILQAVTLAPNTSVTMTQSLCPATHHTAGVNQLTHAGCGTGQVLAKEPAAQGQRQQAVK